jgi:hypothetical protein
MPAQKQPAQKQCSSTENQSVGVQRKFETKALGEIPSISLQMDTVLHNQRLMLLRDELFIGEAMKPAQLMKQL